MPIALLACLISLASQDPLAGVSAEPITLTVRARPLRRLLPELSPSVGKKLTASASLADELVLVQLKNKTGRETLAKLAETLYASWLPEGDGLTLVRTTEDRKRMVADDTETFRKSYQETLDEANKALRLYPTLNEKTALAIATALAKQYLNSEQSEPTAEKYKDIELVAPSSRLMARVLGQVTAKDLLSLRQGERRVFSSRPTAMQVPLPSSIMAACRQYLAEEILMDKARKALPEDLRPSEEVPVQGQISTEEARWAPRKPQDLARVLLILSNEFDGIFQLVVRMYDAKGENIGETEQMVGAFELEMPEIPAEPLKMSTFSRVVVDGYRNLRVPDPTPAPNLVDILVHPEENDPADGLVSDAIVQLGEHKNRSVIAWVPDGADILNSAASRRPMTLRDAWEFFFGTMIIRDQGDWCLVAPTLPSQQAFPTTSRSLLGASLRQSKAEGRLSLNRILGMSPMTPSLMRTMRDRGSLLYPDQAIPAIEFWTAALITKLDATQLRDATGTGLAARRLTADQMAILNTMAYGVETGLTFEPPEEMDLGDLLTDEPTEFAPNGLGTGVLSLVWTEDVVVSPARTPSRNGDFGRTTSRDASSLANLTFQAERTSGNENPILPPDLERLRVGTRRTLTFRFTLNPYTKIEHVLTDVALGELTPWQKLPATFRKAYEEKLAKLRSEEDADGEGGL